MWLIPFVNRDKKSAPKCGSIITWVASCLPLCFFIWMAFSYPITMFLKPVMGHCAKQMQDSKELRFYYPNAFQQPKNIMSCWLLRGKIPPNIWIFQIEEQDWGGPDWKQKRRGTSGGKWQMVHQVDLDSPQNWPHWLVDQAIFSNDCSVSQSAPAIWHRASQHS